MLQCMHAQQTSCLSVRNLNVVAVTLTETKNLKVCFQPTAWGPVSSLTFPERDGNSKALQKFLHCPETLWVGWLTDCRGDLCCVGLCKVSPASVWLMYLNMFAFDRQRQILQWQPSECAWQSSSVLLTYKQLQLSLNFCKAGLNESLLQGWIR